MVSVHDLRHIVGHSLYYRSFTVNYTRVIECSNQQMSAQFLDPAHVKDRISRGKIESDVNYTNVEYTYYLDRHTKQAKGRFTGD